MTMERTDIPHEEPSGVNGDGESSQIDQGRDPSTASMPSQLQSSSASPSSRAHAMAEARMDDNESAASATVATLPTLSSDATPSIAAASMSPQRQQPQDNQMDAIATSPTETSVGLTAAAVLNLSRAQSGDTEHDLVGDAARPSSKPDARTTRAAARPSIESAASEDASTVSSAARQAQRRITRRQGKDAKQAISLRTSTSSFASSELLVPPSSSSSLYGRSSDIVTEKEIAIGVHSRTSQGDSSIRSELDVKANLRNSKAASVPGTQYVPAPAPGFASHDGTKKTTRDAEPAERHADSSDNSDGLLCMDEDRNCAGAAQPTQLRQGATMVSMDGTVSTVNLFDSTPPTTLEHRARTHNHLAATGEDLNMIPGAIRMGGMMGQGSALHSPNTNDINNNASADDAAITMLSAANAMEESPYFQHHIAEATIVEDDAPSTTARKDSTIDNAHVEVDGMGGAAPSNDIEKQVREKILSQAVEAEVQESFWTPTKSILFIIFIMAVVGAIVGAVLATRPSDDSEALSNSPTMSPTTGTPSFQPSMGPSAMPTMQPTLSGEANEVLDILASNSFDGGAAVRNDLDSPQRKAFLWLISDGPVDRSTMLERYAMATLFYATDGENWKVNTNWLSSESVCDWWISDEGAVCDLQGFVWYLQLSANNLQGTLPLELGLLESIRTMEFPNNQLVGALPPQLGDCKAMTSFDVSGNDIEMGIPDNYGSVWDALLTFNIAGNGRINGTLPVALGNALSLTHMDMSDTSITGQLPSDYDNLRQLTHLDLSHLQLDGSIPDTWWQSLTKLRMWSMADNAITGTISSLIGTFDTLTEWNMEVNQMFGPIPTQIGDAKALRELILGNNQFTGGLPDEIGQLAQLEKLFITRNQMNGTMPASLGNLTKLEEIEAMVNGFTGDIPPELFYEGSKLRVFKAGSNQFTHLPSEIGLAIDLRSIFIHSNQFKNQIPSQLGQLTFLTSLVLHSNPFPGTFPTEFGELTNLRMLSLQALSNLSSPLPSELGFLTGVNRLRITDSTFSGTLPTELGLMTSLRNIKIQNTNMRGAIPVELANITALNELSLYKNAFTGGIPVELLDLPFFTKAAFAVNGLNGTMPLCDAENSTLTKLEVLTADCEEVDCPCCTTCCKDGVDCNPPPVAGKEGSTSGGKPGPPRS